MKKLYNSYIPYYSLKIAESENGDITLILICPALEGLALMAVLAVILVIEGLKTFATKNN